MALAVLHLVIMVCLFTRDSFAKFVNEQCFLAKFLAVTGLTLVLMFVDNSHLRIYVQIAGIVSVIFLLYQSISLIDFGYNWNDTWVDKYTDGTTFYGILLILGSIGLFSLNAYLIHLNFSTFWISGCALNKGSLMLNILIIIAIVALVLLKYNENSSILTAFFISLLYTYYNGSALASYDSTKCNPFITESSNKFIYGSLYHILVNLLLAFITCVYTSVSDKTSEKFKQAGVIYKHDSDESDDTIEKLEVVNTADREQTEDTLEIYKTNEYVVFHLVMVMFSIYLTMIFFDWKKLDINLNRWGELLTANTAAFWIKMLNNVVFIGIYVWTLIAPYIIENRDFN